MEDHFKLSDEAFEELFASCQLDPVLFSHEAHLRLSWIHITKYGLAQAEKNIPFQIKQFAEAAGANDKFKKDLTAKAIKIMYDFMSKSRSTNFKDFIEEFPELKTDFKELLNLL